MGSKKRRAPRRTPRASQKLMFPVGELARARVDHQQQILSKSKELANLKKKLVRIKKKVGLYLGNFVKCMVNSV